MSYFAIITFDLKASKSSLHGTNVYNKITDKLEDLDFYKSRHGKRRDPFELPANTYVAEFENNDYDSSSDLTKQISDDLNIIFGEMDIRGKFFIFLGEKWHWRGGGV